MHSRQRSSADGYRQTSGAYFVTSARRSFNRRGFSGQKPHYLNNNKYNNRSGHPPPPLPPSQSRKADVVLLEAGRLAAEYLVFKGLIPASLLPTSSPQNNPRFRYESEVNDTGRSELDRRGCGPNKVWKPRRQCPRRYDRSSSFSGRDRSYYNDDGDDYSDIIEDENESIGVAGFNGARKTGFDEAMWHPPHNSATWSEVVGESGNCEGVADDSSSKISSSSIKKDAQIDPEVVSNKDGGEVWDGLSKSLENDENEETGDAEMKGEVDGELNCSALDAEPGSGNGHDLVKLLGFGRVPTRPRSSSVLQKIVKAEQELCIQEKTNIFEVESGFIGASKPVGDEAKVKDGSKFQNSESKADEDVSIPAVQPMEEDERNSQESSQIISASEAIKVAPEVAAETGNVESLSEAVPEENLKDVELPKEMRSSEALRVDEYSIHTLEGSMLKQYGGHMMREDKTTEVTIQQKPLAGDFLPKLEPQSSLSLKNPRQLPPASFKIRDLNLMESPEMSEMHHDPASGRVLSSTPTVAAREELSADFNLPLASKIGSKDRFRQLQAEKAVPLIDLEDCPGQANGGASSEPTAGSAYPNMDSVLNRNEHPVDLPSIQESYSLMPHDLLGNDIPGCPSAQTDLNNLQSGFGLPGAEVFPGEDIYVAFGELPIGFMEVWDQPPQDYGNFF